MNISHGVGSAGQALSLISRVSNDKTAETESIKPSSETGAAPVAVDAAKLTGAAGLLSQALSGQVTGPDARASQVQAIQASIAAGTYHVPAAAVADKLIESLLG